MDDISSPELEADGAAGGGEFGQSLSIKDGDSFLVADAFGDIGGEVDGFFIDDTRILSRYTLLIGGRRPSKLSSALSPDNAVFTFNGANRALPPMGESATPRGVIHIERKRCLKGGRLFERIDLTSYGLTDVVLPLTIEYAADFRDMFEVRGATRAARGDIGEPRLACDRVAFDYLGLDGLARGATIRFSPSPLRISSRCAEFAFTLSPGRRACLYIEVGADEGDSPSAERFLKAVGGAHSAIADRQQEGAGLHAPDGAFGAWIEQSRADVAILTTELATGPYPYAGIPWFSTPFGRDGIITAWQMLWLDPSLARGVLAYLASRQARTVSAFDDAAPGKIMHETRRGEMAAMKEVPFGLYYGGVDTTPLFVALAGAYLERTDDLAFIGDLWPALIAAIGWLESDGDGDGDGLIDYVRGARSGLANQGWKDSVDSVFHDDGRFAPGPIALVEVQGYAFAAWRAMARMAARLGERGAEGWTERSEAMREAVEGRFWMEEAGYYAMAIDGEGRPCRPAGSNPGHLLFVGLPTAERAAKVAERLLSPAFDSGWGLRTLALGAARYNPMSYHNGSVWPHDTAIAAAGMARYGERAGVAKLTGDLFDVAKRFEMRMPELLCGFARQADEPPIAYPVACRPQAWAAGSTFMMLQASLGLAIDAPRREVRVTRPTLPAGVDQLVLENLRVGGDRVDIRFQRLGDVVAAIPGPASTRSVSVVLEG